MKEQPLQIVLEFMEVFLSGLDERRRCAFTLAEVLITLGIIGVVAAMTLSSVVNTTRNKELQMQFKKTYSELNQVARMYYNDNGIAVSSITSAAAALQKYIKGLKIIDDWLWSKVDEETGSSVTTMPYKIYPLIGNIPTASLCDVAGFRADVGGRIYSINDDPTQGQNGPIICADINGKKKPNRYGMDIFLFVFTTDGFVIPMGQEHPNNSNKTSLSSNFFVIGNNYCKVANGITSNVTCAYYALSDTHPSKPGKNYWHDFLGEAK